MAVQSLITDLEAAIGKPKVITPASELYEDSLKRFADTAIKQAVNLPASHKYLFDDKNLGRHCFSHI